MSDAGTDVREVLTEAAPAPIGPYSQAVVHGGVVYCSGQVPIDPETGKLVDGGIEVQAEQVLANLAAVLEAAGASLDTVVRAGIYLTDLSLFPRVNEIYARAFASDPKPARSTIGVAALPLGAAIEMDAIAVVRSGG